ncbi:MAG: glycosyl hydrolase [Gemmatimonadota bacterium]|nr:glycosyl hydrolase [Gemmatimonadota bacterium]
MKHHRPALSALVLLAIVGLTDGLNAQTIAEEFDSLHFRSIGPATMSGRISDLAVYEANPAVYYVATAHGGLWKTTSGGALFEPLFQNEGLIALGDVAISQTDPDLVWVGAGESNNRQTTSWGGGVYKSTDGGRTFEHMGLEDSRHINRILIDPRNPDVVLVAATGPLFGSGGDRGVFKTTNGGDSWTKVLGVDDDTGANALVRSGTNLNTLYASTYQRRRNACCMNGGGPGSGVWKSVDGGDTWSRVTGGGFPDGPLGRIEVDVYSPDDQIVYALIEGPRVGGNAGGGGEGDDEEVENRTGLYRSQDGGATWELMSNTNPRPMYFSQVRVDPADPDRVYMGGVGLHLTVDGGKTFATDAARLTHDDVHAIWINPENPDHVLIGNDGGLAVSWDASRTWSFLPNLPVGLFYHVNYDMERPFNVCGGMQDNYSWCGPSATRQNVGITNYDWYQVRGGDGFVAMPDLRNPRIVYAESQGGNMVRRDIVTGESKSIRPSATNVVNHEEGERYRWHWDTPFIRSPNDPGVLIAAAQKVFRSSDRGDSWVAISPDLSSGADRDTIRTMGVPNSDVTIARNDGISNWPTLVSLAESPVSAGTYYTGGDDGTVHVSRDGGGSWQRIDGGMLGAPAWGWVSEVVPSAFEVGRVYVTIDNHLNNDYEPYVWVSEDYGETFRSITDGLEGENIRTLTEDHRNPDVLYVGTETGIFLTLDRGESWRRLQANLPSVRVDEITLHERDNAMIVATHGRALFILDHLEPIQEYGSARMAEAQLFSIPTALQFKRMDDKNEEFWGHQYFVGENPPAEAVVQYYLADDVDELALRISDAAGNVIRELVAPESRRQPGIRTMCWDQRVEPIMGGRAGGFGGFGRGGGNAEIEGVPTAPPAPGYLSRDICETEDDGPSGDAGPYVTPGSYQVALVVEGTVVDSRHMTIVMDSDVELSGAERVAYDNVANDLHELQRRGQHIATMLGDLHDEVTAVAEQVESTDVAADLERDFDSFRDDWDALRVKFGVPARQGGRRFGRAPAGPENVFAQVSGLKDEVLSFWEPPSDALIARYYGAKPALEAALSEAGLVLANARGLAERLDDVGISMNVPEGH